MTHRCEGKFIQSKPIVCKNCKVQITDENNNNSLDIRHEVLLETIGKFCYLGDILDAYGGCSSVVGSGGRG